MMQLEEREWRMKAERHRQRLEPFVGEHLARRSRSQKHPVHDFLFEYYSFRPAHLAKWSPGIGISLLGAYQSSKEFSVSEQGTYLDPSKFPAHRIDGLREILEILVNTAERPAFHGCFGLHEWAMVYRAPEIRHAEPLRLADDVIAKFVDSQVITCSHYDAFRFFTPAARHLNLMNPTAETRAAHEQPGCIHVSMDLYKWAYKFYPWIGSDLIADAFEVAKAARELDMRAAPYDLAAYGVVPVPIETVDGRREYAVLQKEIAQLAAPVRRKLIEAYRELLEAVEQKTAPV